MHRYNPKESFEEIKQKRCFEDFDACCSTLKFNLHVSTTQNLNRFGSGFQIIRQENGIKSTEIFEFYRPLYRLIIRFFYCSPYFSYILQPCCNQKTNCFFAPHMLYY